MVMDYNTIYNAPQDTTPKTTFNQSNRFFEVKNVGETHVISFELISLSLKSPINKVGRLLLTVEDASGTVSV